MVHSRRRHGLYSEELAPVHEAIRIRLQQLTEERSSLYKAEILFRVLFRFDHHHGKQNIGRCKYPQEINWTLIENYVNGPLLPISDILEIVAEEGANSPDNGSISPSTESPLDAAVREALQMSEEAKP